MTKNLLNLFFPKACCACTNLLGDNEQDICTGCRHSLPVTNYHFIKDNQIEKVFYGRIRIECATSLFHFQKKGLVQQLLHNLKYKGHENIGAVLGLWLSNELKEVECFKDIDIVVPVPLHNRKKRKRGFNQVTKFGQEIANTLNSDFNESILIKTSNTKTQVFKNRISRWNPNNEIFDIKNVEKLTGKHILLVDDIITTGATIEACVNVLSKVKGVKVSIATMAIA